jgi:hypothetical protein
MFIERIWPFLPTPIVYVVLLVEALVALSFGQNFALLAIISLWSVVVAFLLGAVIISRPFHFERLIILLTISVAQASVFAVSLQDVHVFLHIHDDTLLLVARIIYAILWLLIASATLAAYARNKGSGVDRTWPFILLFTFVVALFPIEPDAFIHGPADWLWLSRFHFALVLFFLVSLGDAALVLHYHYRDRITRTQHGHRFSMPSERDVDVSLLRTLIWSPLTLWVMYVPHWVLVVLLALIPYLVVLLYRRWRAARLAHVSFIRLLASSGGSTLQSILTFHDDRPVETVISIIGQLDANDLDQLLQRTGLMTVDEVQALASETHHRRPGLREVVMPADASDSSESDRGDGGRVPKGTRRRTHHSKHERRKRRGPAHDDPALRGGILPTDAVDTGAFASAFTDM